MVRWKTENSWMNSTTLGSSASGIGSVLVASSSRTSCSRSSRLCWK